MADAAARVLVRLRIDLFVPGGDAHRAAGPEPDVTVRFRPFLLGPIFKTQGWDTSPFSIYQAKGRHMWRDLERLCEDLGLPFRPPDAVSAEQPAGGARRAGRAAAGLGRSILPSLCFTREFAEGRRIDQPATLAAILSGLDVDAQAALDLALSDENKLRLREQTEEAQRLGVFGAPTFTTAGGELFWGNDRLEQALRWARRGK